MSHPLSILEPLLLALLLLLAPLLCPRLSAQPIEVPGDFADLQAALDAAPPGATVIVHGGFHEAVIVRQPLTLVGDPAPTLLPGGDDPQLALAPLRLAGPGSGTVRLVNLRLGGFALADAWFAVEPSVTGGGFERLVVHDSLVEGAPWDFPYNVAYPGAHAIDVDLPLVWIERCTVRGADAANGNNAPVTVAYDAGTGLRSTGTVVVLDSSVSGGNGVDHRYDSGGLDACPPAPLGGAGGHGVVAPRLLHAGSSFSAGSGSRWLNESSSDVCFVEPDGTALVVDTLLPLPDALTADGPARPDQTVALAWSAPGPVAALFLALDVHVPAAGFKPPLPVPPLFALGLHPTPGGATLQVPDEPALVGLPYVTQLYTTQGWSRAASGVVLP